MSFPPQSQGGEFGSPSPPAGGDGYGHRRQVLHQASHQEPQNPWPPSAGGGKGPGGPKTVAIAAGAVVLVTAAVGGLALGLGGGDDDKGDHPTSAGKASRSGDAATGARAGAGAQSPSGSGQDGADLVRYVVLSPGQCFDHPGLSSGVTQVTSRSCDRPHDGEVIADEKLTGSFTASADLRSEVLKLCEADAKKRMESIPADGRTYYYYAIYPSLNTYRAQRKDVISCALTLNNKLDGEKLPKPLP